MCGFIGILNSDSAVREIYDGLVAVQHRGQDAAGIVTYDGRFHVKKGEGLVRDIFLADNVARLRGGIGIGHVRYPTVGSGGGEDAQPFVINYPYGVVMAHNGNVSNYHDLKRELEVRESRHIDSGCDVEVMLNIFAGALGRTANDGFEVASYYDAVREVFRRVRGSYSTVGMIAGQGLFAFRDPYGIKPMAFGRRLLRGQPSYAVASESVVLDLLGFTDIRTPNPGEAIFVDMAGELHSKQVVESRGHPCLFEFVYFARPDSELDGVSVYHSRIRMGEALAEKIRQLNLDIDVVVPVPDSARTGAQAIATALDLPFREGLVKNRYVGRTFIMPDDQMRKRSLSHKLNAIRSVFDGNKVLIVDDSIVRGHTSQDDRRARAPERRREGVLRLHRAAHSLSLRVRDRHADPERVHRPEPHAGGGGGAPRGGSGHLPGAPGSGAVRARGKSGAPGRMQRLLQRQVPDRRRHPGDARRDRERAPGDGGAEARRVRQAGRSARGPRQPPLIRRGALRRPGSRLAAAPRGRRFPRQSARRTPDRARESRRSDPRCRSGRGSSGLVGANCFRRWSRGPRSGTRFRMCSTFIRSMATTIAAESRSSAVSGVERWFRMLAPNSAAARTASGGGRPSRPAMMPAERT